MTYPVIGRKVQTISRRYFHRGTLVDFNVIDGGYDVTLSNWTIVLDEDWTTSHIVPTKETPQQSGFIRIFCESIREVKDENPDGVDQDSSYHKASYGPDPSKIS